MQTCQIRTFRSFLNIKTDVQKPSMNLLLKEL